MEEKLKKLFDLQWFEQNGRLAKMLEEADQRYPAELSDDALGQIAAAGDPFLDDLSVKPPDV